MKNKNSFALVKTPANTHIFHCLLTAAIVVPLTSALGASGTWTQATSGGLWSAPGNWSGGTVADGSGFTANFSTINITADNTVQMDAPHILTALTFGDTTSSNGWTLANDSNAANILTLAGTTPSISVNTLASGKTVNISAVIAGTTGWSKIGAGTLTLSGVNTYDAPTSIASAASSVTLSVNSINSIGAPSGSALGQPTTAANGQINIGRNGTLVYTGGTASSDRNFNLVTSSGNAAIFNSGSVGSLLTLSGSVSGSAANFILRGAQNITASGQLTLGAANLLKVDAGTVTLSNPLNALSGFIHVQGGTLSVNSITAGGAASPLGTGTQIQLGNTTGTGRLTYTGASDTSDRTITLAGTTGGGIVDQSGTGLLKFTSDLTVIVDGAKTLTFQGSTAGTGEFAGVVIDSGAGATSVTKTGTGTWTLSGSNTFTGTVSVNQGQLILSGVNTYDTPTNISTVAGVGATVTLSVNSINSIGAGSGSALGQPTTAANGQINLGRNGRLIYTGDTASSDRNFNLPALGGNAAIQNSGTGLLTLSGTITASGTPTTPADFIFRGEQNIAASGQLTLGATNLLKVDVGTTTLSNPSNAFSGYVQIQNGTLSVNSIAAGGVASALGTGTQIQLGNITTTGTLVYTGIGDTSNRTLTLAGTTGGATLDHSGTGNLKFSSTLTATGAGSKTLTLQGSTAGTGELNGTIVDNNTGSGFITSVTKGGTGTWTLTGSNTYTGGTTVSDGTLKLGNGTLNTSLADTSTVTIAAGAKLHLDFPTGAGTSDTVKELYLGTPAVQVPLGTYDATTPIYGAYFLGTGSLTVTTGPISSPFVTWVTGPPYNLSGPDALFDADPDSDGLKNGLEWILGGNPTTGSPNKAPAPSRNLTGDLVLNFTREETSIGQAILKVLIGTDLASWPIEATVGPTSSGPDVNGVVIAIDTAATPDAVTVTIPAALAAPGGKIFSRLQATQP